LPHFNAIPFKVCHLRVRLHSNVNSIRSFAGGLCRFVVKKPQWSEFPKPQPALVAVDF